MTEKIKLLWSGRFSLLKTLFLNFRLLPFKDAIHLPFSVSRHVKIRGCKKGTIRINGEIKPFMISLGFGGSSDLSVYNPPKSLLEVDSNSNLVFEGKAHFAPHFSVLVKNGATMKIGNGFSCNNGCKFSCICGIEFGENCLLGGDIVIRDSDGHMVISYDVIHPEMMLEHSSMKPIKIGNHVWICNKSNVLKGVTIGNDCIISYGSLVVKPFNQDNLLLGGVPAKVIKENINWKR